MRAFSTLAHSAPLGEPRGPPSLPLDLTAERGTRETGRSTYKDDGGYTIPRALTEPEVSESELVRIRREKLARIAALGYDPFPTTAPVDTSVADVVARYAGTSHDELEAEKPRVKIA